MSETKFTKGEWKVYEYGQPHWNNPALPHVTIHYGDNEEHIVDTVYELANAYLIAASPEMYALLERVKEAMLNTYDVTDYPADGNTECDACAREIDALLAKARGE